MEQAINTKFFWAAFITYSIAMVSYLLIIATEKSWLIRLSHGAMAGGLLFQTLGLIVRTLELKHLPLANMYEYITVFIWFAGIGYFIVIRLIKNALVGALCGMVIFMLMVAASLLPKEGSTQLLPALQSYWLQIHVTLAAASEAIFAIGFASSILYFIKGACAKKGKLYSRIPNQEVLDMITYRAIAIGYPLFTVGALFAGAIWAQQAWGSFWSWDPKETCSLVVWIIYSLYLHARLVRGVRGALPHILSIGGFIAAILTFFSSMVLGGLHAYT